MKKTIFVILLTLILSACTLTVFSCEKKCEHSWGEWTTVTEAMCTKDGEKSRTCTVCGDRQTETIPAGHMYGEWMTATEATCITDGENSRTCTVCGDKQTEAIPAGHIYSEWVTQIDATCTTNGTKGHYNCSVCGKSFDADKEELNDLAILSQGHKIINNVCKNCGEQLSQGLSFALYGDEYRVTGIGTCTDTDIFIPSVHNGKPVTGIGDWAFDQCKNLTSITIPNSVTYIGNSAFKDCIGLTSITIPDSVTNIREWAFYDCTGLTSVTIPNSVTSIEEYAFSGCTGLTNITIPDSVTCIAEHTFSGCISLTSVSIPNSVTNIKYDAFSGCTGLTNITIPDSVTCIAEHTFFGCTGLTNITIPDSVTSIGTRAFKDCTGLTSVTIPSSVIRISSYVFDNCPNLIYNEYENAYYLGNNENPYVILLKPKSTSITTCVISDKCKFIDGSAFENCSSLTKVAIPDSVTSIESFAFSGCTSLTSIVIPDSVTNIGGSVFSGCSSLQEITIPFVGEKAGVTSKDAYQYPLGYLFDRESYTGAYNANQEYSYGSRRTSVDYYIPSSLKKVTVTGGIIFYGAFHNCYELTSVTFGNDVTNIENNAFKNCNKLTSVTIGNGVTSIASEAFKNCNSISKVYYKGTDNEWSRIEFSYGNNSYLTSASRYYYSESNPFEGENAVKSGNYWHYDTDGKTILVWTKE